MSASISAEKLMRILMECSEEQEREYNVAIENDEYEDASVCEARRDAFDAVVAYINGDKLPLLVYAKALEFGDGE
jgi:hypothetical protein